MNRITLNDGKRIPVLGFGTYKIPDEQAAHYVSYALMCGYRHIDTASIYGNERGVGRGIVESGLPREDIFLTTKLWKDDTRPGRVRDALQRSLERLDTPYVDLYLMHWPVEGCSAAAWEEMEELRAEGLARSIGVSNFNRKHLIPLLERATVRPAVNQIELHPMLSQNALCAYCAGEGIAVECHRPLGGSDKVTLREHPVIAEIAANYGITPSRLMLRWSLQKGNIVLVKSVHEDRIRENAAIFDFSISDEDCARIDALDCNWRVGSDPGKLGF